MPDDPAGPGARVGVRAWPQLLTYPDSLGGDLASIRALLDGPLAGLFGGIHILPPFPSSADRGFAPVTYRELDPRFGDWDDIAALAADHDVLLDLMVNHIRIGKLGRARNALRGPRAPMSQICRYRWSALQLAGLGQLAR